jgi:hypothetical protein
MQARYSVERRPVEGPAGVEATTSSRIVAEMAIGAKAPTAHPSVSSSPAARTGRLPSTQRVAASLPGRCEG